MSHGVEQFMRHVFFCLSGFVVAAFIGCESKPQTQPAAGKPVEPPISVAVKQDVPKATDPARSDDSIVTPIDAEGLQAAVNRHAGKVVLVDCWATWCIQCIKDFPHTVEMSKKYADQGLVVMSLSFDDLSDEDRMLKVREFLSKQGATFENYISKLDLEKEGATDFQIEDGALPHYKLYGRDGKLIKALTNADPDMPMTHSDLEQIVEDALK